MQTQISTYFTVPDGVSRLAYSASTWLRVSLQLETAGPVSVGTREDVSPVLSGKGVLLPPGGDPVVFVLSRGSRLFIASESINRVKLIVEPIPWLEEILGTLGEIGQTVMAAARRLNPLVGPSSPKGPPCPPNLGGR